MDAGPWMPSSSPCKLGLNSGNQEQLNEKEDKLQIRMDELEKELDNIENNIVVDQITVDLGEIVEHTHYSDLIRERDNHIVERRRLIKQIKDLQEHKRKDKLRELQRRMDDKERELHDMRKNNEAVWAKVDLLRKKSKNEDCTDCKSYIELVMPVMSHKVVQGSLIKQIKELQEHNQEKERHYIELQEQHWIVQETIVFKDERIREAQAWTTHAQAMQSATNHTLQAELRDWTEQYNKLWLACQSQFGELERLRSLLQQLQLQMADAREKRGSLSHG